MKNSLSRRSFIRSSAVAGVALAGAYTLPDAWALAEPELYRLSADLVRQWGYQLLSMQITDQSRTDDYGGIWCPADKAVHGRVGDTIYPFFYLAKQTKDHRFINAAVLLYRWIERRVSQPDGSWLNEPQKGSWQGTTVFMSIALGETLKQYSDLMEPAFRDEVSARLKRAGEYVRKNFTVDYGNINYPISGAYCLSLLGDVLNVPEFKARGKELAHEALKHFSPKESFLYGEGDPDQPSAKGCYAIDLGYNVEESLPALTLYGLQNKDEEVLNVVTKSLQSHLELMLPDGGWDNSWGTRNYKWTWWGSRTSDGCQTAYALMADRNPGFYKAALLNTQLMLRTTVNGLLQGGPHFAAHGVPVCVHHTFTHIKALVTILEYGSRQVNTHQAVTNIPREQTYGVKRLDDIQTWLVSTGDYRATITGYDKDYKHTKNGHPTGGALSLLWHKKAGVILCGSMNDYQMVEAGNQQTENDPHAMPLTPRVEVMVDGKLYMNISDQQAVINSENQSGQITVKTRARLVDKDQKDPASGPVTCLIDYVFTPGKVQLSYKIDKGSLVTQPRLVLPMIALRSERATVQPKQVQIKRAGGLVKLVSDQPLISLPTGNGRVFNFVPGLEALPLAVEHSEGVVEISVV